MGSGLKTLAMVIAGIAIMAAPVFAQVKTDAGVVEGTTNPAGVRAFLGVPYAAPPVGALRWQAPQPVAPWTGVKQAATFGARCMQGSIFGDMVFRDQMSEDCLYLNVWAPASAAKLPVMVWIYGGGFQAGSASEPRQDGSKLATKGVVVVSMNYRLGVFGFFAHPDLTKEASSHASGNYGLLDQIAALRWVRDNITAFGGDPGNVTIFGQSAGAMSAFALLVSPLAGGLFQRAIGQSGSPFSFREVRTLEQAEQAGVERAASWGATELADLRALSTAQLLGTRDAASFANRPGLTIDGWALPDSPARMMADGRRHPATLLVGATADEGTSLGGGITLDAATFRQQAEQRYGDRAAEFLRLYPLGSDADASRAQIAAMSDNMFAGMRAWAEAQNAHSPQPAFLYYFDRKLPGRNSAFFGAFPPHSLADVGLPVGARHHAG